MTSDFDGYAHYYPEAGGPYNREIEDEISKGLKFLGDNSLTVEDILSSHKPSPMEKFKRVRPGHKALLGLWAMNAAAAVGYIDFRIYEYMFIHGHIAG